jgi:hypothetical protein
LTALVATAAALVTLMGCAKVPQVELDAARAQLGEAEAAEAAKYASAEWEQASAAMTAVDAALEEQDAKFTLLRSYDATTELIATATTQADNAKQAAIAGKEAARQAATMALDSANAIIASARTTLTELGSCRGPKGFAVDLAALNGSVEGLEAEAVSVAASLEQGDFLGSQSLAEVLAGRAQVLVEDLENAKSQLRCP